MRRSVTENDRSLRTQLTARSMSSVRMSISHEGVSNRNRKYFLVGKDYLEIKHGAEVKTLCFGLGGKRLVTGCADGKIAIISADSGLVERTIDGCVPIYSISFDRANGKHVAVGLRDSNFKILNITNGHVERTIKHGSSVRSVQFAPDGHRIAVGSIDGQCRIMHTSAGVLERVVDLKDTVRSVAFDKQGRRVATGTAKGVLQIFKAVAGLPLEYELEHGHTIRSISFSPSGDFVATGCEDGEWVCCAQGPLKASPVPF